MKLFMLRADKNGKPVLGVDGKPVYFDNKMDAKQARDKIGGTTVVSYGTDHKLYKRGA
jgi:hypothetical protein